MGDEFGGVTEEEDDDNQAQQVGHRVFTAVPRADRIVLGAVSTNKINYWRIVVYSSRVFCLLIFYLKNLKVIWPHNKFFCHLENGLRIVNTN